MFRAPPVGGGAANAGSGRGGLMLRVCCFKWKPPNPNYRSHFDATSVNVLRHMVDRHYPDPHEVVCITDDPIGIETGIRVVPLWIDYDNVPSPHGAHQPSCYRRLKVFSDEALAFLGERFVCLDLDTVIVGDLRPLWNREEDFVIWGETDPRSFYNGSMFMLRAGTRTKVWTEFNPRYSPRDALRAGRFGSDQGWISYVLGRGEAMWGKDDGVYSFRVHLKNGSLPLPRNARIVMFHGKIDPWSYEAMDIPWIQEHYR